ncbi:MAG: zinc-binding protein [Ruminococcaceae bacterium]|nr:zinc-binding protein [Oscillospiraceae bacterium]
MYEEENVVVEEEVFEDETLVCKECGNEFVFTAGEKQFYKEKGFVNKPKCCKACRDARKNAGRAPREVFETTCAECGGVARVNFQPSSDRPVYCSACFEARKNANQ